MGQNQRPEKSLPKRLYTSFVVRITRSSLPLAFKSKLAFSESEILAHLFGMGVTKVGGFLRDQLFECRNEDCSCKF